MKGKIMNKNDRLGALPMARHGNMRSVFYEISGESDTDALVVIQEAIQSTGDAIKSVGAQVDTVNKSVAGHDARIVEIGKSVEQIVTELETTKKSLETHVNMAREALKNLPAGNTSGLLGNRPFRTGAHRRGVTFDSVEACKSFGLLALGHCSGDVAMRAKALAICESSKSRPFFGDVHKALSAGNFVQGGATVPDAFLNELIFNIEEHGVFQPNARRWPMPSGIVGMPKVTGRATVYYPEEGVDITVSDPTTGDVTMTARLYATLFKLSNELSEDSAIDLGAWLGEEIVDAHALARDTNGFTGTGLSTQARVTGLMSHSDVVVHILGNNIGAGLTSTGSTSFSSVVYTDLAYMQGLIPTKARRNAKWYMHRHILAILKGIVTTAGDPIVIERDTPLGSVSHLLGDPIVEVDVLPSASDDAVSTDFFAYGDLRLAFGYGERRSLNILNSQEAGFASDSLWIRSTARIGIVAMDGTQMVKARTSAT